MQDPIQRHPTREEQLDILVSLVADGASAREHVLDLGCGTGYVAKLLLQRSPSLEITGVDLSKDALTQAQQNLAGGQFTAVQGDLSNPDSITLSSGPFRFIYTCLTFHDLAHPAKRHAIRWAAEQLTPDGVILIYDRLRLDSASLFPLQQSLWKRIARIHGNGMRDAATFASYQEDIGVTNNPASLGDYLQWLTAGGLEAACLHLHGNIALIAGARPKTAPRRAT